MIFGQVSPSGKLAQSIPLDISDDPSTLNWPGEEGHVDYGEGVFVGYRYYDTYGKAVDYPFGYGLSYATFEITGVAVAKTGANTATVTATVTNTSDVDAAETVQVYVAPGKADVARPKHELKGFTKVFLKAGESKTVTIDLDERAFAYWSEKYNDWHVEAGEYAIEVGVSSRDIADTVAVALDGDGKTQPLTEWSTYGEWEPIRSAPRSWPPCRRRRGRRADEAARQRHDAHVPQPHADQLAAHPAGRRRQEDRPVHG